MSKPLGQTASPETVENKEEPTVIWSKKEKDTSKEIYGTELLIESGCKEDIKTTEAPTDAMIVTYEFAGKERQDLTRGSRVDVFDMYYDKFKGGLKKINYGKGNVRPGLWMYQKPKEKKKRR